MIRLAESQYVRHMRVGDLIRFARTVRDWSALTPQPSPLPEVVWIETTNACNLRCRMCPTGEGRGRPTGRMDWTLYRRLLDQCAGRIYGVFLFFGGEPLCDPQYPERIREARERGLRVFVHTNGTLLDADRAQALLDAEPTTVSVSLDTMDANRYAAWRRGADHAEVLANVRGFLCAARERTRRPVTIVQLIDVQGSGARDARALRAALDEWAPDEIRIRALHDWAGHVPVAHEEPDTPQPPYYPCALLWKGMTVCWDGRVVACCNDLEAEYEIGDAHRKDLADLWAGDRLKGLRAALTQGRPPTLCQRCVNLHHRLGRHALVRLARTILGGGRRVRTPAESGVLP